MAEAQADADLAALERALQRADSLEQALIQALDAENYRPFDQSNRILTSVAAASLAIEHGRAMRVLVAEGMLTAALSLLRVQHEALVRAVWLLYAASDVAIGKLTAPLSKDAEAAANKLPMMADMLKQLEGKPQAVAPLIALRAFKENNAPALNSFVHGGLHALTCSRSGYPVPLLVAALRNGNGLMLMAVMMLAILAGRQPLVHAVSHLQATFSADLPPPMPTTEPPAGISGSTSASNAPV
ncbi:DUF6988 family protein [Inhella gelatinilytica]|uniref:Uncharacterized protein n=1 Tax=Inhella gelatinilytica TaxID=2795030 RepID=A0A931NFX2_9BURK|nr:hypothetical protein [Inhella gelatinilytica]MBH9553986.1 hypothetical protein [Inhella gelatinilytica]